MFPFKSLGPPRTVKQSRNRWPRQVGLFGHKLSYFSRDWLGISVTLHNSSWGFKLQYTQSSRGREGRFTAIPIMSSFPRPLLFCLNSLFLFIPWSPNHQQAPVIVRRPTWKSACGVENTNPFQVSVVTTFITHKRDREPQLSTEPLVFTLLYLFVYWFCHSSHWSLRGGGVGRGAVYCTKSASTQALLERAIKSSISIRWELECCCSLKLRSTRLLCVFMIVHTCVILKTWLSVGAKETSSCKCIT